MNNYMIMILLGLIAYLLGSIPTGVVYGKMHGVDIRKTGSGSTGATNVARTFGSKGFAIVFILDLLKGYAATILTMWVMFYYLDLTPEIRTFIVLVVIGIFSLVGHSYPIFNKFRGGKGVATGFGIAVALCWWIAVVAIIVFLIIFKKTKTVAIASISGFLAYLFTALFMTVLIRLELVNLPFDYYLILVAGSAIGSIWVFFTHRDNLRRLVKGEENTFKK